MRMYALTFDNKADLLATFYFLMNFGYTSNQLPLAKRDDYKSIILFNGTLIVSLNRIIVFDATIYDIHNIKFYYYDKKRNTEAKKES